MVNQSFLFWTKIGFITLSIVIMALAIFGLWLMLKKSKYSKSKRTNIALGTVAMLAFWCVLIAILSLNGFFLRFDVMPPRMFLVLTLPIVKILYLTLSGRMDHLLSLMPPAWLLYIQAFRVPVEILLWMLLLSGVFPGHLTFEGRNWDIIAGIGSPIVGYLVFVKKKWSPRAAVIWNIISLGLLLNIVIMAVLTFPTPFQVFKEGVSNAIVAQFPVIYLPAILVVAAFAFHCFSLRQLSIQRKK